MDLEYDQKFDEMKKYIPFLESMIKRLESTSSDSNPRQAQLDKIRSLRDLLMDKKKRMKMENLLKCEQVLVNLYAKVEQRDGLPKPKNDDLSNKEKSDLNLVRSKLKSVVSKLQSDPVDTLPDIARASETEEVCVPGSKETALFQRRPNITPSTPLCLPSSKNKESPITKRTYTRVLLSPERSETFWPSDTLSEQPLFSRRSPKKSPRKRSPTYNKKERKKILKNKLKYNKSKDLNITLNVPEDSLNSLNTKDILSRIINCSDSDVDIETLRELRTQILGELKETGANDDISDIILKSYKNKKNKQIEGTGTKKSEVEEGELSDSESEAIQSIYGSLVVLDKNKSVCTENKSSDKDKPRKIQICLVINSDKTKPVTEDMNSCVDTFDFETFNDQKVDKNDKLTGLEKITLTSEQSNDNKGKVSVDLLYNELILEGSNTGLELETKNTQKADFMKDEHKKDKIKSLSSKIKANPIKTENDFIKPDSYNHSVDQEEIKTDSKNSNKSQKLEDGSYSLKETFVGCDKIYEDSEVTIPLLESTKPILEPSKGVSEIDILQALKKEILSETSNVLNPDTTVSPLSTPLLHQPKITKVANAIEIGPKKRISIESYKAKANSSSCSRDIVKNAIRDDISRKQSLKLTEKECERFNFLSKLTLAESSDDEDKSSLSIDDIYTDLAPKSPDHEDFADTGLKPPVIIPSDPVQTIAVGSAEMDVDMRELLPNVIANDLSTTPLMSPLGVEMAKTKNSAKEISKSDERVAPPLVDPRIKRDISFVSNQDTLNLQSTNVEKIQSTLSNYVTSTSVVHNINVDQISALNVNSNTSGNSMMTTSVQSLNMTPNVSLNTSSNIPPLLSNMTPNRITAPNVTPSTTPNIPILLTPSRTPNIANMTPNRTPNIGNMTPSMTPSRHTFDNEDCSNHKHVYAPMFSVIESRDGMDKSRENHQMQWDTSDSQSPLWEDRNRICSVQKDIDYRETRKDIDYRDQISHSGQRDNHYRKSHSVQRDIDYRDMRNSSVQSSHHFDQRDCDRMQFPTTPSHPFGRMDCPPTPTPSFGRLDCPPTPTPSFGRLDCPPTPTPSFGRLDCPPTPTPSFGRLDCPPTPTPSFGRLDCPATPTPSFGRLDCPPTPAHLFGRSDCPLTPSHSFGRNETLPPLLAPNFGRSEYNQSSSRSQDPRLNRSSDYDGNQYREDDRDRAYFNERKFYSGSYNTDYQSRELFKRYPREHSIERKDRNKNYDSIHNYRDQIPRHERSVSRSFSREDREYGHSFKREYEGDRYSRNRGNRGRSYDYRNRNDSKNYDEYNRRSYQRDKSLGKTQETVLIPVKNHKVYSKISEEKKLRVNHLGEASFTIDTSVNNSFQEMHTRQTSSSSFDARRRRSSSVGRSLSSIKNTSMHETKHAYFTEKKIRNAKDFRRACSVGRDVEYSKLDFNDIKADLRSFKFNSGFKFSKDDLRRVSTESPRGFDHRSERKIEEHYDKFNSNSKYSPRKNPRDPRMRRENSRESTDGRSSSRDTKNYGIVYSNDNISKGTILGSGYGVKNYKIPKIKKLQEVVESSRITNDVDDENVSSSKNQSLDPKEKGIRIKSQIELKESKSENENVDEKNIMLSKSLKSNDIQQCKNSDIKELENDDYKKEQEEVEEYNAIEKDESETSPSRKSITRNCKLKISEIRNNNDTKELSCNDSSKKQEEVKETTNILNTSLNSNDSIERRVTRSARKTISEEPMALELSPKKRTRKAKKSLIIESESDDSEMLMKPNSEESKKHSQLTLLTSTTKKGFSEQIFSVEDTGNNQFDTTSKELLDTKSNVHGNITDKPVSTVVEPSKQETEKEIHLSQNINTEKQKKDLSSNKASKLKNCMLQEKDNQPVDDLNSGFGLSDLEMFSDNVTSDPVIDNINDLIADLDHDLNSTKTTDTNSHFTKELSLETMLENITSLDKSNKKEIANVSSCENDLSEMDKSNKELYIENPLICSEDKIKSNVVEQTDFTQVDSDNKEYDELQTSEIPLSESVSDSSENKIKDGKTGLDSFDKESEIPKLQPCVQIVSEINEVNAEVACSNDAIVSTSEDGITFQLESLSQNLADNGTANSPSTPDSTINNNMVELKNVSPIANESRYEMNSDITSTHGTEVASKDLLDDVGTSTEIESIGKLLSILQDKTKIKELLSLLDGQSSKNEKIKKKLEKLSEIVSDDESTENNLDEKSDSAKSVSKIVSDHCNKNVTQAQEESNKVDSDSNVQDILKKQNIVSTENNCETSSVPKGNRDDTVKSCSEGNAKPTNSAIGEIDKIGAINNVKNDEIPSDLRVSSPEKMIEEKNVQESSKNEIEEPTKCENVVTNPQKTEDDKSILLTKKKKRKRGKKRIGKRKQTALDGKRLTRSEAINLQPMTFVDKPVVKKPSRELKMLHEDFSDFLKDGILSATGIRMCRIAKLVDDKKPKDDAQSNETTNQEPSVVLKTFSDLNASEKSPDEEKLQKKKILKTKNKGIDANNSNDKALNASKIETALELNPKTKIKKRKHGSLDPYDFETDSLNDSNNASDNKNDSSTESESDSVVSTKSSESTELSETKKKVKRKRGRLWQAGVIKPKNKKKKSDVKPVPITTSTENISESKARITPDFTCFTDRTYCFRKNVLTYNCRICLYSGTDIVHHYKKEHPHTEVPLSRLSIAVAKDAINESEDVNFQGISKISSKKYVCRFCFKEFTRKKRLLEAFFWHVVSMHTGEYKQTCSKCIDTQICPLNIDIPRPPKDANGQLLGYICEKCNHTQISLKNLKTHVIIWHNNEETAVYTINLASLSKSAINNFLNSSESVSTDSERPRILRSSRSNQSMAEVSDDESDSAEENIGNLKRKLARRKNEPVVEAITKSSQIQSKITFESDIPDEIPNFDTIETIVKIESGSKVIQDDCHSEPEKQTNAIQNTDIEKPNESIVSKDIFDYPHFKIMFTESGSKVYVCCINGNDYHYKTSLLISMKKHVQLNHTEKWDGYCCLCKVIVTSQGEHKFKDCFHHFLDKHIDSFPILEPPVRQEPLSKTNEPTVSNDVPENLVTNKSFINVRPLSDLLSNQSGFQLTDDSGAVLPVIESVISLGSQVDQPRPSPSYPTTRIESVEPLKQYNYEEFQADIMSRKHRVVLEAMMSQIKLVQVFKCAGRFCSFTTDNAEDALLHASTHMRVGGVDSLCCVYCDFDSFGNAIDLITHVFKYHSSCPYVCSMCFYRAATSQLVSAHIKRLHNDATKAEVLKSLFQNVPIQEETILSRETAVPYYVCCDTTSPEGPCNFRTYTPGKFCEHLQLRHSSSTTFSCFICSTAEPTPSELIHHLMTHGLKLYQCTSCVFGADDETELLEHCSAQHPTRQPKAYLRIITNKEGTNEFRVLPLAQLNKLFVPVVEVPMNTQKEFPVREAERSIDLEKLIGHTNLVIDLMTTTAEKSVSETEQNIQIETAPQVEEPLLANINNLEQTDTLIQRATTPIPPAETTEQLEQSTPVFKTEILELTPEKVPQIESEIVCLDSDDESPSSITSLSAPRAPVLQPTIPVEDEMKKVDLTELFVCSKCKMIVKCGSGFRKHINACFANTFCLIPCVHCSKSFPRKNIVTHYNAHCDRVKDTPRHYCSTCSLVFSTANQAKEHQLKHHNVASTEGASMSSLTVLKEVVYGPKSRRKRCLISKELNDKAIEPPEKIKRYGPLDIEKLPINPILEDAVVCSLCEFNTKVRLNMVRHLQMHAQQQPVPQTAPVNPVPHLETNEKHFDKMVNLASSSIGVRPTDRIKKPDANTLATLLVPPDAISRFPKYVSDKQRLTCGAKDCSYTSVDESMLKCHWETLHYGTNDFHCVHCPPYQQLDKSKPVSASRILGHLKMHDERLYACSLCFYYHYRQPILEKHLVDVHKGGQVMIVRDGKVGESSTTTSPNASLLKTPAPTMDLKPWQCGLCKFKSLLRPEVVNHCAKIHNSKMQFKCVYCAFRTSNPENITKHQSKSHVGKPEEIFYYYYREGSVPDEADGTTRWQKQSQDLPIVEPTIKFEDPSETPPLTPQKIFETVAPVNTAVDLNLVKKEIEPIQETLENLCDEFGEFCEPNGLKYKCPLCTNVIEDSLESMQSHLYEELKYRKWGCSICSYKAFHKEGLAEHMQTEHRQNRDPIALPVDNRVETWVAKLLEHQTSLITKHKENLAKQKLEILRTNPGPSTSKSQPQEAKESIPTKTLSSPNKPDLAELEQTFGPFGASSTMSFCCPKCNSSFKEEDVMHSHLENELNKIRWYCSNCSMKFQTYHEAQFHSRSVHIGLGARPVEVTRDATVRAAWIDAVIKTQKQSMDIAPVQTSTEPDNVNQVDDMSDTSENSLLVVRYEKRISNPEDEMARRTPVQIDSDDEKLIIDEPLQSRVTKSIKKCPHCNYTSGSDPVMRSHILRHYSLKPFMCPYCDLNGTRKTLEKHQKITHATKPIKLVPTPIPSEPPSEYLKKKPTPADTVSAKVVCLVCRNYFTETESLVHTHENMPTTFGKKGEVVVQCNVCHTLHKDVNAYEKHHKSVHPELGVNYVFSKLNTQMVESKLMLYACGICPQKFSQMKDIKAHADANHQSLLKYTLVHKHHIPIIDLDDIDDVPGRLKRRNSADDSGLPPCKRTARKSTTKLPQSTFARKSTTKLPFNIPCETQERSSYGKKPSNEGLEGVVTMMPFYNKMVPFTFDKLKDIINIDPIVVVEKKND